MPTPRPELRPAASAKDLRMGNEARAKELYAKALSVQPDYTNAKQARRIVEGKAD